MKYLILKSMIQLYLGYNCVYLLKYNKITNYFNNNGFLLKNKKDVEIEDENKYLELELNSKTKQFLKRQSLFDLIEVIVELRKKNISMTSLSHHLLASILPTIIHIFGNNGNALPFIIIGLNQFTGALGFNLYILLKKLKFSKSIQEKHEILMIMLQLFTRIPLLIFIMNSIMEILSNKKINKRIHKYIYKIELIGGIFQLYNEIDWLIYK